MFSLRSAPRNGRRPLVVAHRGDQHGAPENTFAAFRQAAALGADVIELDVQLTRDGVPVVIHDDTLGRTTDSTGPVRERDWAELRGVDAGSWYDPAFRDERVPSLLDVLDWAADQPIGLLVEIKASPFYDVGCTAQLTAALASRQQENVVLYSSDHLLLAELAGTLPHITRGPVINERTPHQARILADTSAGFLSQSVWVLTPDAISDAHAEGILVCSEARYPSDVGMLTAWGVDLIVSSRIPLADLVPSIRMQP